MRFFFFFNLFSFDCIGSSLLQTDFLWLRRAGAILRCGVWASHCGGFSCCGARAVGARASVVVAHGLSCSAACGIFPEQGSNPCPLHWQADSEKEQSRLVKLVNCLQKCMQQEKCYHIQRISQLLCVVVTLSL